MSRRKKAFCVEIPRNLLSKREVLIIAGRTQMNRYEIAGRLLDFWGWASKESDEEGFLRDISVEDLQKVFDHPREFWDTLLSLGWLDGPSDGSGLYYWIPL